MLKGLCLIFCCFVTLTGCGLVVFGEAPSREQPVASDGRDIWTSGPSRTFGGGRTLETEGRHSVSGWVFRDGKMQYTQKSYRGIR